MGCNSKLQLELGFMNKKKQVSSDFPFLQKLFFLIKIGFRKLKSLDLRGILSDIHYMLKFAHGIQYFCLKMII